VDGGSSGTVGSVTDATSAEAVFFNPFEPGFTAWPYDQYRRLREHEPVHRTPLGSWNLSRYADVVRILRDPTLSVEQANATPLPGMEELREMAGDRSRGARAMLNLDPPDHDRLRRLVSKAFTPKTVQGLRPRVQELVDGALDRAEERGEMDVVADLAFPLPFTIIAEMLGMPTGQRDEVRNWSHTLTKTLDPFLTTDDFRTAFEASDNMTAYVSDVIEQKRRAPDDDVLSRLIAAEDEGDVLDHQEVIDQVVLLFIAGHETTVNLIGNGTVALLRHRDQLERWHDDPDLDMNAVEELLRYDSPVQFSRRIALTELELDGTTIEPGAFLFTGLGSANRDPGQWGATADDLDLGRANAGHHVSFGGGVHHCLGSSLARTEAQVALGTLVRRFPRMELATDEPVWNGRIVLRGLDALPVTLS
jgi:cytochrome P450